MNKVIMIGRLTGDPVVKYSAGDTPMAFATFSIAVPKEFKKGEADFFNCTAFGKQAEIIEKYFKKGSRIALVGRVENNDYTNRDGQKVHATRIAVKEIEFVDTKNDSAKKEEPEEFVHVPESISDSGLPFN